MNKAQRVVTALKGGTPDMVPYIYNTMMKGIQERIIGHEIDEPTVDGMNITGWLGAPEEEPEVIPSLTVVPEVAEFLGLDAIQIQVLPPLFVHKVISGTDACVGGGKIDSAEALASIRMPDPDDERLMRQISDMIRRYKGNFALGARVRLGASPTILSMGMENLSYFLLDEEEVIYDTVHRFTSWSKRLFQNLCELDFDFFWTFDDIAFTNSLMFSPAVFRKYFKESLRDAASAITKPLIFHSDGNYQAVLDDIIEIGADAIHPIERKAMDHRWLKEHYGKKLCLVGNIDINHTLTEGTPEEVDAEVKARIEELGPGGGFIISDSNSIPDFCRAENIIAMSRAVQKYRHIY